MERRIALSIATAAAVAITAGGAAFAANAGLLGTTKADPVGELSAANVAELVPTTVPTTVTPEIVVIDEFITVPGGGGGGASAPAAGAADPSPEQRGTAPTGGVSSVARAFETPIAPVPTTPNTVSPPETPPGPGWEWDDDDQKWEYDDDDEDDDYDDDDYDDEDEDEDEDDDDD